MLPGMDGSGSLFQPFLAAYAGPQECRVVSYPDDPTLDYESLEAYVRSVLPTAHAFVLVAESFSGPLAMSIAAKPPAGLKGLIMVCSFASNPQPAARCFRPLLELCPVIPIPVFIANWLLYGRWRSEPSYYALSIALSRVSRRTLWARMRVILSKAASERSN